MEQMEKLIKALQILMKYGDPKRRYVHAEHDELIICGVNPENVPAEDKAKLEELGFFVSIEDDSEGRFMLFC